MARTITFNSLTINGLNLTIDPVSGEIGGEWVFSVGAVSGERLSDSKPITFTSGEQTQIRNFLASKLNQLKASEGI